VIIKLTKVWGYMPLKVLIVFWLLVFVIALRIRGIRRRVRVFLLSDSIFQLDGHGISSPVLDHPVVNWLWLSSCEAELWMEFWIDRGVLSVSIPSLSFDIFGLSGSHVLLSGKGIRNRARILVDLELPRVNWGTLWRLKSYSSGR
jgi:hypothetical protein